jgi:hypothetical protein
MVMVESVFTESGANMYLGGASKKYGQLRFCSSFLHPKNAIKTIIRKYFLISLNKLVLHVAQTACPPFLLAICRIYQQPILQIYLSSPLLPNFNGGYLQGVRIDLAGCWIMNFAKWVSKILSAGLGHISQPRTGPIPIISKTIIKFVHSA